MGELEQSCENFETCFRDRSKYYTDELTPRVQSDMASRIEAFKSGETLVQQIKFLLADSPTRETPEVDTSRFELGFPEVPAQRSCPLTLLEDDKWVPTVTCADEAPVDEAMCPCEVQNCNFCCQAPGMTRQLH